MDELNMKRKKQLDEARSQELEEIGALKMKLIEEENDKRRRKEKERHKYEEILREREDQLREIQRRKEEETALDIKLMADMKQKFDEEERTRAKLVNARLARNDVISDVMGAKVAFNEKKKS